MIAHALTLADPCSLVLSELFAQIETSLVGGGSTAIHARVQWERVAMPELLRMARGGNAEAQAELAWRMAFGEAALRDGQEARRWAQVSMASGSPAGFAVWGWLNWLAVGGERNAAAARAAFEQAQEDERGKIGLALCWLCGEGGEQDGTRGRTLLQAVAEGGHLWAAYWLGRCAYEGAWGKPDFELASHWLRIAADGGIAEAADLFARCCHFGRGVSADSERAVAYWRQAAHAGVAAAQFALGLCRLHGVGEAANAQEAVSWLRAAARAGVALAMVTLAQCLERGWGCRCDPIAARAWREKARAAGCVALKEERDVDCF